MAKPHALSDELLELEQLLAENPSVLDAYPSKTSVRSEKRSEFKEKKHCSRPVVYSKMPVTYIAHLIEKAPEAQVNLFGVLAKVFPAATCPGWEGHARQDILVMDCSGHSVQVSLFYDKADKFMSSQKLYTPVWIECGYITDYVPPQVTTDKFSYKSRSITLKRDSRISQTKLWEADFPLGSFKHQLTILKPDTCHTFADYDEEEAEEIVKSAKCVTILWQPLDHGLMTIAKFNQVPMFPATCILTGNITEAKLVIDQLCTCGSELSRTYEEDGSSTLLCRGCKSIVEEKSIRTKIKLTIVFQDGSGSMELQTSGKTALDMLGLKFSDSLSLVDPVSAANKLKGLWFIQVYCMYMCFGMNATFVCRINKAKRPDKVSLTFSNFVKRSLVKQ